MPIKVQKELPARAVLESENIFIMDEDRAMSQDIRPLEILILNLRNGFLVHGNLSVLERVWMRTVIGYLTTIHMSE